MRKFFFPKTRVAAPSGHRAYAVGDVHGRLDLLDELLDLIERDDRGRGRAKTFLVFLGDLIDRGPSSAQVIERLRTFRPGFAEPIFLLGNHEEVMLQVMGGDSTLLADWLRFGGAECIESYGLSAAKLAGMRPLEAIEKLREAVPKAHLEFLESFSDTLSFGSYLFVHAGIRPGVQLAEQRQSDLRWIRAPFLDDDTEHGFVVVHGHTPSTEVEERPNRVGIDTGAYKTGVLTAVGIERTDRWFLQTGSATNRIGGSETAGGLVQ